MRRSNEELWNGMSPSLEWLAVNSLYQGEYAAFADAVRADEAEVVRCECCDAYSNATKIYDPEVRSAIRNAGKAPVLKPGMLVKSKDGRHIGRAIEVVESDAKIMDGLWFIDAVAATRAEIDEYRERAPE